MKRIKADVKFPYPVQGMRDNIWKDKTVANYNDRVLSVAECFDEELKKEDGLYKLKFAVTLNDNVISELIKRGDAQYACEIECAKTLFRHLYMQSDSGFYVEIPEELVYDDFSVTISVLATQNIESYYHPQQDEDFDSIGSFPVGKGNILSYVFYKVYYLKDAKSVASFITIELDESAPDVKYELIQSEIIIKLPKDLYDTFMARVHRTEATKKTNMPYIMSSIINEALIYAIMNIQSYMERPWAEAIKAWADKEYSEDVDWDDVIDIDEAIRISHSMLKNPFATMFECFKK